MKIQGYFDMIAKAKKEFDFWIKNEPVNFKCLQFVFPFVKDDKEITTYIFYQDNLNISEYNNDGTTKILVEKFKWLLEEKELPIDIIKAMKFEIDSHENVVDNFEGNYFYRLR